MVNRLWWGFDHNQSLHPALLAISFALPDAVSYWQRSSLEPRASGIKRLNVTPEHDYP